MPLGIAVSSTYVMLAGAAPAGAASNGNTTTTFVVAGGALSISVPATADLGTVAASATTVSADLGQILVVDNRAVQNGSWTATVSSTSFTTGGQTGPETIPNTAVTYDPTGIAAVSGTASFNPGTPGPLGSPRVAFSATSIIGDNTAAWAPTITVAIPSGKVAGTYTATITHSVA
jgi:hypothetical protein